MVLFQVSLDLKDMINDLKIFATGGSISREFAVCQKLQADTAYRVGDDRC